MCLRCTNTLKPEFYIANDLVYISLKGLSSCLLCYRRQLWYSPIVMSAILTGGLTSCARLLGLLSLSAASAAAFAAAEALLLADAWTGGSLFAAGAGDAALPEPILRKLRTALATGL